MDSSPDLSLKLRRGSSDSRDNFYMDFAQGIDSDIEEVENGAAAAGGGVADEENGMMPPLPAGVLPPPLPQDDDLAALAAAMQVPPAFMQMPTQSQPLPTLTEHEDLPPTPPPHATETAASSPPASPTTSVLEMIPPPPPIDPTTTMSPTLSARQMQTALHMQSASPPLETEDEGDDADGEEQPTDVDEDEDDGPPPPLPPLPSNFSYVHGGGAHGSSRVSMPHPETPPLTKSPSTSPSPPDSPPRSSKFNLGKVVSPPASHVPQTAPLTPPSESDQSQPNSPPHLSQQDRRSIQDFSPHPEVSSPKSLEQAMDIMPTTPPPEFGEAHDMVAAVLAAAVENTQMEIEQGILQNVAYLPNDENRSYHDDESTTITTPPSNGFSGSSILAPPADHLGDIEPDTGLGPIDIPPPAGLEDQEPEADEVSEEKTPTSEHQPYTEEHTTEDTPADEIVDQQPGSPTPQATPTGSLSPKQSASIHGAATASGSRGPSRSVSRSASRSGSRKSSRSGSMRGSVASRAGSLAAASVNSVAGSIVSGAQQAAAASPQASIRSIRSQASVKSPALSKQGSLRSPPPQFARTQTPPEADQSGSIKSPALSKQGSIKSPQLSARLQSPREGDSPPAMPSPPIMRSPPQIKSPPIMHSPPRVTSPPRVYSPPLVSSPPITTKDDSSKPTEDVEPIEKGTGAESLPSTSAQAAASTTSESSIATAATAASAAAATSLSYADEHIARPHLTSHHHYHLPHQFQHPHHQNHHTHSVPVSTPTVPAAYTESHLMHESRHMRAPSFGGPGGNGGDGGGPLAPSPNLLISSETTSRVSSISPAKSSSRLRDSSHRVTIDDSSLPQRLHGSEHGGSGDGDGGSGPPTPSSSSQQHLAQLGADDRQTGHLALMYHSQQLTNYPVLPAIKRTHRPSFMYPPMPHVKAGDALATLFSALYGKILVVMGIAFPMAEVISTYIPPSFYEVYYLYLYIGSMIFLLFMYATLLWGRPKIPNIASPTKSSAKTRSTSASESLDESDTDSNSMRNKHIPPAIPSARRPSLLAPLGRQHHYGSFYLRMGAVAFGIGSMIYSGLEFGQYFELNPDTKCHNVLLALTPATRMAFIFIQMYFIFLNNEQIKVYRYKIIARFGLMHMIGTNLAVWLNVLIQETKHEILTFYNPENRTLRISHRLPLHSRGSGGHAIATAVTDHTAHLRVPRGLKGPYQIFECRRTNILGTLVQDASPFLFPCTIEYSLICAAILYVMWRSISRPQTPVPQRPDTITSPMKRSPHHYSVDCARAHKGLFVGILILVLTIISLILFFVLIQRPDFVALAVTEVTVCELLIYGTATMATLIGMIQIRVLQYDAFRSFSLDDILLVGAQTGSFLYNIFTVIAGQFSLRSDDMLVPLNAMASIVQTACQTMFILDASRRQAMNPEHIRKKPGREIVTFMLVVNLAMWAISTLEKSRAESHPIQLNFYGLWAWTIITHVSMPLAIFYRFHSTVCLCEIWKRAYKLKPTYM